MAPFWYHVKIYNTDTVNSKTMVVFDVPGKYHILSLRSWIQTRYGKSLGVGEAGRGGGVFLKLLKILEKKKKKIDGPNRSIFQGIHSYEA